MMEVESSECPESEENKDDSKNKETLHNCDEDCKGKLEENKNSIESKETANTCGRDHQSNSEENKDSNESKETATTCIGDVGEISNNEGPQISDEQKKEETESTEAFIEEGDDGESEPEFFNMEDFEVVDVVDDEDDQGVQCTSSSQVSDNMEKDTGKAGSKHGQSQKSGSSRSHKYEKRDKTKNPKDVSRFSREGKRSSSNSSKSHVRTRSKEKSRRASSKDRVSCDQPRGPSEKSDKQKNSRASHKQDNRKAVEKDRCSSQRSDHKKRDHHHSDSKRVDDKRASSKEKESGHRKREFRKPEDKQVHSDKINDKKTCQDQQNSNKRESDKYKSEKRMKDKEYSDEKNAAIRKQNEDMEKFEKENDNSKELNEIIADNEETSVGYAEVNASCEFTNTVCEMRSVSCLTSSVSLDKTSDICEILYANCELISNEDDEMIAGNSEEEPKISEEFEMEDLESKPTIDSSKQEDSECKQVPEQKQNLDHKDSKWKDTKVEQVAKDFEQKDLKYGAAYGDCKWEDPKSKQAAKVCEYLNTSTVDGTKENMKSKPSNESSKEKIFEKQDTECKHEIEDMKKKGSQVDAEGKGTLPQNELDHHQPGLVHSEAGQTEDKTGTGSEQANVSDEIKEQISKYIEMIRKEVDEKDAKDVDRVTKKVIGRPSLCKFNKVIVIGDSRIKYLDSSNLKETFENLEISCVPCLTIDNLQEVFDQHVMQKKYPQGILLICSVGIYNIIGFCSNISCKKDHKSMEQIYIKNSLAKSVIGKMRAMRNKLQKMLGKDSEVIFTTILPVNVIKFITHQVKVHSETTGHTPVVRSDWSNLENTVHKVIDSFNCEVINFSMRKDGKRIPWELMHFSENLECQKELTEQYFENGLDPSKDATLTQMVPRFQFTLKQYSMNRYQQVVLVGDSRIEVVASNWPSCNSLPVFTILTQSRLCFQDLSEENAVVKEIMGLEDSLIVISLGMYDFLKYVSHEGCESHEPLEMPCLYHEKSDSEEWNDIILSLKRVDQLLHRITSNCDVIITTIYSFDYHFLKNFEIQKHAATTGHVVKSGLESKALYEKLDKVKEIMKRINRIAIRLAQEKRLPTWDIGGLVWNLSKAKKKDALTLFDGAHPSTELANRIANACISYAEASMYLCCPDSISYDVEEVADLDTRLFTRISNISSLLESNDFTLPLSEFHDEKERKEGNAHSQDSDNKRCMSNKNLISVNLRPSSFKGTQDLNESEIKESRYNKENEDGISKKEHDTKIISPTQSDDVSHGQKSSAGKQKNNVKGCSSSKSPFHKSVSPASRDSSPSANVSPFSDISCASSNMSNMSYLENISPSSLNILSSPDNERKCKEIDEKQSNQDRKHSPAASCGSVRNRSWERSHHSLKSSRFSRSPHGCFSPARSNPERYYSPVRTYSSERSGSLKRKQSRSREHSRTRCHSPAKYHRRGRYFSPEINNLSPTRSLNWSHSSERNFSADREGTYSKSHKYRSRSPVRYSSKERHYSQERSYRNRSPRSYTPVGSDRSRDLYNSRKNDRQYSPDRHFSPTRERYNRHMPRTSHWERDSGQQENCPSYIGQHGSSRRDENSSRSRSRSRYQSRKKKRSSSKSKKSITMRALESLHEVHVRECDMYRQNPAAHPDYNKEYWAFVDKKVKNILALGGDPYAHDTHINKDWEMFWPTRLQEIFNEGWEFKRNQCISMLIANIGRCRSSSPISSCSSVSSSRSSDKSDYSRRYHKKRDKYSKSAREDRERRQDEQCRNREKIRSSDRNKDSGTHHTDKGELKQEQRGDVHRVRDREKDKRDRKDDHLEAKLSVSESVQKHNLHAGGRQTAKDLPKQKDISSIDHNNVTEHVYPGKVTVAPMTVLGAPLVSKEAAVTRHSGGVCTNVSKVERNVVVSNDSHKGKMYFKTGKEHPNDAVGFKNQHSFVTAPPVDLEDSVCKSDEKAQKVGDLKLNKTKQSSEEEVSSTTPLEESSKTDVIDVLEILSRLGERLGALLVPVQLLHQKAVELRSSGLDTMQIFDEIDNKILLHMTGDKLRTALKGDDIPIIQKVIIQEGEQRLRLLLEKEKDRSLLFDLNIDNIATACLGKSSVDTITFIENALLYHGYTEVPKGQLKKIYMAVKKEQVRVMGLEKNRSRSGIEVVDQSSESPEHPGNSVCQGSLPQSRHLRVTPSSSMQPQPSGSAPYSPSQISVSSEDSLPALPQIMPQPVPLPFLGTADCFQSSGGIRSKSAMSGGIRSKSAVSETTAVAGVAHTTQAELYWKSDPSVLESRMHTDSSSSVSVTYECHSKVSLTCDNKVAMKPNNYQRSHGVSLEHSGIPNKSRHVQKSESYRSTSKGSSKKPIKILLPKPRAPRVFVRAFNPLGEDESESEES